MNLKIIKTKVEAAVKKASFDLRFDVKNLILKAEKNETKKDAKKAFGWILENARIAHDESLAICQDTGFPIVFVEVGKSTAVNYDLIKAIKEGVEAGYEKNNLRPSIVDPLFRGKSTYKGVICHLDFVSSQKGIKVTFLPKGFGSENKTQLKMFNPTASINDIEEFIVGVVKKAGPEACPPFIVGVGIGATSDKALFLAKKALLQRCDKPNPDKMLAILERRLAKKINALKIGPMGLGGRLTALAVKIKKAPTHIAGLPVGVNISCHALRSCSVNFK